MGPKKHPEKLLKKLEKIIKNLDKTGTSDAAPDTIDVRGLKIGTTHTISI